MHRTEKKARHRENLFTGQRAKKDEEGMEKGVEKQRPSPLSRLAIKLDNEYSLADFKDFKFQINDSEILDSIAGFIRLIPGKPQDLSMVLEAFWKIGDKEHRSVRFLRFVDICVQHVHTDTIFYIFKLRLYFNIIFLFFASSGVITFHY